MDKTLSQFQALIDIVAKLRGPKGCPWDKEQTQKSLTSYIVEEAFELVEAIESGTQADIIEELGDFLFQVILQAQIAKDEGLFTLEAVISGVNAKMIQRHPHVFAPSEGADDKLSVEQVLTNWYTQKQQQKKAPHQLFATPLHLPSLQVANKIGFKSAAFKFDWHSADQVMAKVEEEKQEVQEVMHGNDQAALTHEIGDLLFSVAQLARHLQLDPEACLRQANRRFVSRFLKMLEIGAVEVPEFTQLNDLQKQELWDKAKQSERLHGPG